MSRVLYESHMHTPLCKHAEGLPGEYAAEAERRGLKGIIVTCHSPLPEGMSSGVRMAPEQWGAYVDLVAQAREEWAGRVDVRLGVESDWLPGLDGWLEKLHSSVELHHVLGSVHPQLAEYQALYLREGDWVSFHEQYFTNLAEAAESGWFDTLSHPDLVKNYGTKHWDLGARLPHILRCLDRIASTGVAMELNTSGLLKTVPEMNPSPTLLGAMRERGIAVVLGADAHTPLRVADRYLEAMDLLEAAGYASVRIFLERKAVDIPLAEARAGLRGG